MYQSVHVCGGVLDDFYSKKAHVTHFSRKQLAKRPKPIANRHIQAMYV